MIHSVKAHFEERDVHDLRQLSTTTETVLDHADYPQARRLEIVKNIIAGYANVFICLDDGRGNILFQSPNGPDLSHIEYAGVGDAAPRRECDFMDRPAAAGNGAR